MRHVPALPTYDKDATTRVLCSSVHLDDGFARYAHQELSGTASPPPDCRWA